MRTAPGDARAGVRSPARPVPPGAVHRISCWSCVPREGAVQQGRGLPLRPRVLLLNWGRALRPPSALRGEELGAESRGTARPPKSSAHVGLGARVRLPLGHRTRRQGPRACSLSLSGSPGSPSPVRDGGARCSNPPPPSRNPVGPDVAFSTRPDLRTQGQATRWIPRGGEGPSGPTCV